MSSSNTYFTYFDQGYAALGLAAVDTLRTVTGDRVVVFAMSDLAVTVANQLDEWSVEVIDLETLLTFEPALNDVRETRSTASFMWSVVPTLFKFVLAADVSCRSAVYFDADTQFLRDPGSAFNGDARDPDVFLTPHHYEPYCDMTIHSGFFCVQFVRCKRDASDDFLDWWEDTCLRFASDVATERDFGDQKCLDRAVEMFPQIHFETNVSRFVGPWNAGSLGPDTIQIHLHGAGRQDGRLQLAPSSFQLGPAARTFASGLSLAQRFASELDLDLPQRASAKPSLLERADQKGAQATPHLLAALRRLRHDAHTRRMRAR